jgi:hypothetical protein
MTDPRITDEIAARLRSQAVHNRAGVHSGAVGGHVTLRQALAAVNAAAAAAEQAVIERLAGEAGENPYRHQDPFGWQEESVDAGLAGAWDEGAAAGVAAERARTREALTRYIAEEPDERWRVGLRLALTILYPGWRP